MTPRADDLLVGLVALALLPLIGWRIVRGLREGRLPLYRTYVTREESRARFGVLLALHALSFLLVAAISADLVLGLGLSERLCRTGHAGLDCKVSSAPHCPAMSGGRGDLAMASTFLFAAVAKKDGPRIKSGVTKEGERG